MSAISSKIKSIAGALDLMAQQTPLQVALQTRRSALAAKTTAKIPDKFTYQELSHTSQALAGFLSAYGYERKDVLVCDLPATAENLLVQLACNRLGVHVATVPSLEHLAKFPRVKGAVTAKATGFLAETNLPLPYLDGDFLLDFLYHGSTLQDFGMEVQDAGDVRNGIHSFYHSPQRPLSNQQALELGLQAADAVDMQAVDIVCLAGSLNHPFGQASTMCAVWQRGATLVLPGSATTVVSGRSHGNDDDVTLENPQGQVQEQQDEAYAAIFAALRDFQCSLLFCDAPATLEALPAEPEKLKLRGGICKADHGFTFLYETVGYGGVHLKTMGTRK